MSCNTRNNYWINKNEYLKLMLTKEATDAPLVIPSGGYILTIGETDISGTNPRFVGDDIVVDFVILSGTIATAGNYTATLRSTTDNGAQYFEQRLTLVFNEAIG